jgi:hypothetical protein
MPTGLGFADTTTLSNSQGLWLFLVVAVGVLLAGVVVIVGRSLLDKGQSDQPASLIRSWIAISLVLGLLAFCAAAFLISDTTLRSTLFGGLIASVSAAVAFYFSSSAADRTRADILHAAIAISQGGTPPNAYTQATPPAGQVNAAYTYTFKANGQPTPTFQLAPGSGPLPNGLVLETDGTLHGTPETAATFDFSIAASNSAGTLLSPSLSIEINP